MSNEVGRTAVVWRQLDVPGLEHCRLVEGDGSVGFDGAVVVIDAGVPWRLDYGIVCDTLWRTCVVSVAGVAGAADRRVDLSVDSAGHWTMNGARRPDLDGCIDVDLGFTPSTNTLPLRRLAPDVGQRVTIDVAWLEFPSLEVRRAPQRYTRLTERVYRFEQLATDFTADIEVDSAGLVVAYPGLWERLDFPRGV